jgi:hypothetical protein
VLDSAVLERRAAFFVSASATCHPIGRPTISFEQARAIAYERLAPAWEAGDCGEYTVADYGFEDETTWLLIDSGSRLVIDADYGCDLVGRGSTLVDKRTGEIYSVTYLEAPDRFDAMTPVGHHPAEG